MTRADAAMRRQIVDPNASVPALDLTQRRRDGGVKDGMLEPLHQKPLKDVDAPFGSDRTNVFRNKVTKCCGLVQSDTASDDLLRGNSGEQECHPWTQSDADQDRRRLELSLVRPNERSAEHPFGGPTLLQLDRNRATAIGHDADRRIRFRRDNPEASDEWTQHVGGFLESNLSAVDVRTADAHPSNQIEHFD